MGLSDRIQNLTFNLKDSFVHPEDREGSPQQQVVWPRDDHGRLYPGLSEDAMAAGQELTGRARKTFERGSELLLKGAAIDPPTKGDLRDMNRARASFQREGIEPAEPGYTFSADCGFGLIERRKSFINHGTELVSRAITGRLSRPDEPIVLQDDVTQPQDSTRVFRNGFQDGDTRFM